jgi:signal transduction histidine kinase
VLQIKKILHYKIIIGILVLIGLAFTTLYSYDLFHSIAETFSIVIACGVFMLVWNSRRFFENNYFLVFGIGFIFIASLDFFHMISYKGMGVFHGINSDLPTQLWVAARYLEAAVLLVAPFFIRRKVKVPYLTVILAIITILIFLSIFYWHIFPHAFLDVSGLTQFKIISEYIISGMLVLAGYLLYRNRKEFDQNVLNFLLWSIGLSVLSEIFFTSYANVFGWTNMVGHLIRIVSFGLLYEAIIVKTVTNPFRILFRGLKESEIALRKEIDVRKKVESELIEVNKQKDDFLFQTIHDLRAPTNVIQMILDIYHQRESGPQNREFDKDVKLIERANSQMSGLIEDLFMIASGEKTEIVFNKEKLDIEHSVKEALDQLKPLIKDKNILIEHETPIKKLEVVADRDRLHEVLINIVDNAVKYNRTGGKIKIGYEDNDGRVRTVIHDSGIGVASEDLPNIFKPYFRSSFVKDIGGTGLGLYIVKKLVEKMDGQIEAHSEKGQGTSIAITLPKA